MIVELVGLPGAGKTTLAEALRKEGAISIPPLTPIHLFVDAGLFWLSHPVLACKLLTYIVWHSSRGARYLLFMNGYMGYAARYRSARARSRAGASVVLDQGFFQLCVSLQGLPPTFVALFPKTDMLVVVTADDSTREMRMTHRGWAAREKFSEAMLQNLIPSFEKVAVVYHYDGTQNPEEGAALLMTHIRKQSRPFVQTASRSVLKTIVAGIAFFIAQLEHLFSRTPHVAVLMYHAIDESGWRLSIPPRVFEHQMKYLAKHTRVVPLSDVVAYTKGEKQLPARAVALSFDDGYHDLVPTVLPLIKHYRFPITVFLTTDLENHSDSLALPRLSLGDIQTLLESGLGSFESHTNSHPYLPHLSLAGARHELVESKRMVESLRGGVAPYFAYPYGDRSPDVEQATREAGYEAAFSITEGMIHPGDDLFHLKRIQVDRSIHPLLFKLRLTAAVDWNRRIVDWLRRP